MLSIIITATSALLDPHMLSRRAILATGLVASVTPQAANARTLLPPKPFEPKTVDISNFRIGSKVKEIASGLSPERRAEEKIVFEDMIRTTVCEPFANAIARSDSAKLAALYTPGALVFDVSLPGPPKAIRGGSVSALPAPLSDARVTLQSLVPEGEWPVLRSATSKYDLSPYLHAEYLVEHGGGSYRGYWLLMKTVDGWLIDESVAPLESPKALNILQPRRNDKGAGERYLDLKSPYNSA